MVSYRCVADVRL